VCDVRVGEHDLAKIGDVERHDARGARVLIAHDRCSDVFGPRESRQSAQEQHAIVLDHRAGVDVDVRRGDAAPDVVDREPIRVEARLLQAHLDLLLAPARDPNLRDAFELLERRSYLALGEAPQIGKIRLPLGRDEPEHEHG
jgi:hypothetical protein